MCCGTKRLIEIKCPDTCVHLAAARSNPAAVVRRQYEADVALLFPTIQLLTERQHQLFFLVHSVIARHRPDGFARLLDTDIADAAGSVASTLETAAKGVIYEHEPASTVAKKLARELTALLRQAREQGATIYDHEAAITLRAIQHGARSIKGADGSDDTYLTLMGRLLQVNRPAVDEGATAPASSIILP
jgi:hypothetical protein